jgi:UDP-N-acetylmuramate dehydrogenase
MNLRENIPLAPLTTFKVGGPARYFLEGRSEEEVIEGVLYARDRKLPLFVLGEGSNLVIADDGWSGLVIKIAIGGVKEQGERNTKREFEVGAGVEWDSFVAESVNANLAGIETLSGIPGTAGGTPVQNVGAYGQEVSETITSVRVLDLETLKVRELPNSECGFSYRTSIFNSTQRGRYVVLKVGFALTSRGEPRLAYADLKKYFEKQLAKDEVPTLQQTRDAVREIRRSKAMLIVPDDEDCRSAGSFFKNPLVELSKYEEVASAAADAGAPPKFPAENGRVKIPAAWLVERAGFNKGYIQGRVGISKKHSLAIINRGGATAAEIMGLKNAVQRGVREKFGIELQPEPVFVGFTNS